MNRLANWCARHSATLLVANAAVLAFAMAWLPRWAAFPVGCFVGLAAWHLIYVRRQRIRMDRTFTILRREIDEHMERLKRLPVQGALLSLRVHPVADKPDNLKMQYELLAGMDQTLIRRIAMVVAQASSDLDHTADTMDETGTTEYRGGQNPSMN